MGMLRESEEALFKEGQCGDWAFKTVADTTYILMRLPEVGSGPRGSVTSLPVCRSPKVENKWLWDGNRERPTLTPSILIFMPRPDGGRDELWHGYMTAGVLDGPDHRDLSLVLPPEDES